MKSRFVLITAFLAAAFIMNGCIDGLNYTGGSGNIRRHKIAVASFKKLVLVGRYDVFLRQDSVQSIILETDNNLLSKVKFESHGDLLRISTEKFLYPTKMTFYVSAPDLSEITVDGAADIEGKGNINYKNLDVTIHGAGDVRFENLTVERLRAQIDGFGDFMATGSAKKSTFEIDGFGDIRADNFHSNFCDASVNGFGDIFVWADSVLKADIHGAGDIVYYGRARLVNASIDGPGKIKNRDK